MLRAMRSAALALVLISCSSDRVLGPADPSGRAANAATATQRTDVVISQVYGGGGNSGATYTHDFVELFNPGTQPASVGDWRVGYASATGSTWTLAAIPAGTIIQPGHYFLVQMAKGTGGTTPLPTPDLVGSAAMSATAGKVILAKTAAAATGVCPAVGGDVVDVVGFGTTSCTSSTPALTNTTAALRKTAGCTYTGSPSADFATGAPAPRNSASPAVSCGVVDPPATPSSPIVINEVMANPGAVVDSLGEWFEVLNRGTVAVDLKGYQIASGSSTGGDPVHTIATSVVIPAGGYVVIARDGNVDENGGVTASYVYGATLINLGNSADWLALRDTAGVSVDSVAWTATTSGASRGVVDPAADNTDVGGSNWNTGTTPYGLGDKGTPGSANRFDAPPAGSVGSVSLSPNGGTTFPAGYTMSIFATVKDASGANVTPFPTLVWTSSNPAAATVDSMGYVTSVAPGTTVVRATAPNGVSGQLTFTITSADVPTPAVYRNHVEFGAPTSGSSPDDYVMRKKQYVLSYNNSRGGPNWVAWNVNATHFGAEDRCNCFTADPSLPSGFYRVVDTDYRGGGYDRGHMVQSFERTSTSVENAQTFLLTNILPQAANNNQGPWAQFENYINDVARGRNGLAMKEVYVIAGGQYSAHPQTLKGEGKVAIPEYTWKVAVFVDPGKGLDDVHSTSDLEVMAVRMPNDTAAARNIKTTPWQDFKVNVDDIESATGYDLLAALPDGIERIVESNDRAPTAAVDGPYTILEGGAVTLSAAGSSDPDGDALTYAWDFGDGTTGTGVSPTHTYGDNGNYVVKVTVTDPYGASSTATSSVMVVNVAPTVAALDAATLPQGYAYTTAGSFTDPGTDTWTATVDYGDGSGAQPLALSGKDFNLGHTYARAGTYTVTVTVSDDDGLSGTRTATVTVTNVAPSVAVLAGATLLPGGSYATSGSFTDPGTDTWTATVDYGDGSGAQPLALSGKSFNLGHAYALSGTYTVTVTVTDDGGLSGTRTATVTVTNVAPAVAALAGATLLPGESYAASGSFTDPGSTSWTATVDYGDGSGAHPLALSGKGFSLSHTYTTPGTYTVRVTVADDGGEHGTRTATVVVQTAQQGIEGITASVDGLVDGGTLSRAEGTSLNASLQAAVSALNRGDRAAAVNQLEAFVNKVEALQRSGRLSDAEAQRLSAAANRVVRSVNR